MISIFAQDLVNFIIPTLLTFLFLGVISTPISKFLFKENIDEGFANSQIIGLVSISWISFSIATISGLFNSTTFNHNSLINIFLSCILWLGINLIVLKKSVKEYNLNFKKQSYSFLVTFIILLFFYFINAFNFKINPSGTENIMNLGILNSLKYSEQIPTNDFWFSGYRLNYYYFTHYSVYILGNFLNFNPNNDFNYFLTIFPTLFTTSFVIFIISMLKKSFPTISNLYKIFLGTLSILFLLVNPIGSLKGWYEILFQIKSFEQIVSEYPFYTVRIIGEDLIAENFNYAFTLNPLHAHTNSLIYGILILNLLYLYLLKSQKINIKNQYLWGLSFTLGFIFISNTWDFILYSFLIIFILLIFNFKEILSQWKKNLKTALLMIYPIILIALPWYMFFYSPGGSLGIVKNPTNLIKLFEFWGLYFVISGIYFFAKLKYKLNKFEENFTFYLTIFSLVTILLLEIFYVADPLMNSIYYRANTYYKFSNLVILLLSVSLSYFIGNLFLISEKKPKILLGIIIFLIVLNIPANLIIFKVKYKNPIFTGIYSQYSTVKDYDSDLLDLILYLNQNKKSNIVILEGSGVCYSHTNLVSIYTGIPTVYGWDNHESTWRGTNNFQSEILKRKEIVLKIFTDSDLEESKKILKEYKVNYIVISKSERELYKENLKEEKLKNLGTIVFQKNNTFLIKTNIIP